MAIPKAEMKEILKRCNELRFEQHTQDLYSQRDDPAWSAVVTENFHRDVLREHGFVDEDIEDALMQVFSCRWKYRKDPDMQEFFKTLIHVQFDLTGDGPIQVGDDVPDCKLYDLNGKETTLHTFIDEASPQPLVVFAGSWTWYVHSNFVPLILRRIHSDPHSA